MTAHHELAERHIQILAALADNGVKSLHDMRHASEQPSAHKDALLLIQRKLITPVGLAGYRITRQGAAVLLQHMPNPFKVGDRVKFKDGKTGVVSTIESPFEVWVRSDVPLPNPSNIPGLGNGGLSHISSLTLV
jgi:hypothetical protein